MERYTRYLILFIFDFNYIEDYERCYHSIQLKNIVDLFITLF